MCLGREMETERPGRGHRGWREGGGCPGPVPPPWGGPQAGHTPEGPKGHRGRPVERPESLKALPGVTLVGSLCPAQLQDLVSGPWAGVTVPWASRVNPRPSVTPVVLHEGRSKARELGLGSETPILCL